LEVKPEKGINWAPQGKPDLVPATYHRTEELLRKLPPYQSTTKRLQKPGRATPIAQLRDGMKGITVEGTVVKVERPRTVKTRKTGENVRVAHALLEDETGAVKLILWEDQIEEAVQGSRIRIHGAYVQTWVNEKQLLAGKTGVIVSIDERTEAHDLLRQLENGLRRFIIEKLEAVDKNYWKNRIPQDVREQAERRISEEEAKRPHEAKETLSRIYYVNFPDLVKIIRKRDNWRDLFQAYFQDEDSVSTKLRELEPIRNAVAHNRPLDPEQLQKLRLYAKDLLHAITGKSLVQPPRGSDSHAQSEYVPPSPSARAEEKAILNATGFRTLGGRRVPVIRQNRLKDTPWTRLDLSGHIVEWELNDAPRGWYTGFVWIDGQRYSKAEAWRKYVQPKFVS
jgi:hypothetical protein